MMKALEYENFEFHNKEDGEISKNRISRVMLKTEPVTDGMSKRVTGKRRASSMDLSLYSSWGVGDICNEPAKIEWTIKEEALKKNERGASETGRPDIKQEMSVVVKVDYLWGQHLTPDNVARVIGQRWFQEARKTILQQQKIFSLQILELHRLTKVQRLIARSPQKLDKLLDMTIPDRSPHVAKPKNDILKPNADKVYFAPKLLTTSTYVPSIDQAKLAPWFFSPPVGNQWLVPIRSPSEGLVYKPYHGPCFPTNNIAFNTGLGQGCSQYYAMPLIDARGLNFEIEQISSRGPSEKDILALFPMAPRNEMLTDENDERKPRVIKAAPHNRISATASAARIFESLKEEREFLRTSSCESRVS